MEWLIFGGVAGIVTWTVAVALAVIVYAARPSRTENRVLAILLFLEGAEMGTSFGLYSLLESLRPETTQATFYGLVAVNALSAVAKIGLYLLLLASLRGPIARRLRAPVVRVAAVAIIVVAIPAAPLLARHRWTIVGSVAGQPMTVEQLVLPTVAAFYLFALFVAVSAYRATAGDVSGRRHARAFVYAFGSRDIVYATLLLLVGLGLGAIWPPFMTIYRVMHPVASLAFCGLLVYGFLYTQLFDIDLRVKRAIGKGTIAAMFVAVFFVVSELAQQLLAERGGSVYVGILASGLLVFALAPLQRIAERVANAAIPHAAPTPEYLDGRKRDVYRAALEGALSDGVINPKERDILTRLQLELGIANADARAMEDALRGRAAA